MDYLYEQWVERLSAEEMLCIFYEVFDPDSIEEYLKEVFRGRMQQLVGWLWDTSVHGGGKDE